MRCRGASGSGPFWSWRRLLEACQGVEAVAAPLVSSISPQYRFCFVYGPGGTDRSVLADLIRDLQRKRAATKAEQALQNSTGCARTEGIKAVVKSGGSGRITRALVRSAEDAKAYVGELRAILVLAGVTDGKFEEGSLRVDANVSIRGSGLRPDRLEGHVVDVHL